MTASPVLFSTGTLSPVITEVSIVVSPDRIVPSSGIISPASTVNVSPTVTSSTGTIASFPSLSVRAVCGVNPTSFSIPAFARDAVKSSSNVPNCIIKATSPAAKYSPTTSDAKSAKETRTSALISCSKSKPRPAPKIIGTPHKRIAAQAGSTGHSPHPNRLAKSGGIDKTTQTSVIRESLFSHRKNIRVPPIMKYETVCLVFHYRKKRRQKEE